MISAVNHFGKGLHYLAYTKLLTDKRKSCFLQLLFIYLFIYLFTDLFIYLLIYLFVCLFVCLFIYLFIYLFILNKSNPEFLRESVIFLLKTLTKVQWETPNKDKALFLIL